MLRVLFVNENVGGHATMHAHLRGALAADSGVEATFYDLPLSLGIRLAGAPLPGLRHLDLDLHAFRLRLAQSAAVRRRMSRLEPMPDVLHFYTQNTALLSAAQMRRTPSVISIDSTNRQNSYLIPSRKPTYFTAANVALTGGFERRAYMSAARVVAHSQWAADSVLTYGVPAARVEVIPFGIEVPAMPERTRRESETPRIVFVGFSMERKGGWRLVRIWKRLLADRSRLLLVTPEHVGDPEIEVRDDVRPGDGKLMRILAEADILAFPSEMDPFGYAMLEGMAAGLPVVAFGRAAVPEIVEHGLTGLVVPAGDEDAYAQALASLVDDAAARQELGAAARARVVERFDAKRTTADLVRLLRDVAA